jgi:predicted dienelactone hydrolase
LRITVSYDPFARGDAPVGVRTIECRDAARGSRPVPVELWYPATVSYRGKDLDGATCDRFAIGPGLPEGMQRAVRDAEPAVGRYPLVLHSHCAASHRRDAALLGPHLSSHGYIVVAPDHMGDTLGEALADAAAPPGTPRRRAGDHETVVNRPADALFALDSVLAGADPAIAPLIDRERIGICGVSLGGWTSLRLNSLDHRPKAAFVAAPSWGMSGPFPQTKLQTSLVRFDDWRRPVPTLLIAGERDMLVILADLRELAARLPSPKRFVILQGASHFHWAEHAELLYDAFRALWEGGGISVPGVDVAGLAKATPPFSELCPTWHGTDTLQTLCLAHMDAHLKDNAQARAFLESGLARTFAERGIGLEVA